ncbi:DNA-directed DNA polymerase, partial [Nanoarchaeota archaeon]
MAKIKAFVVYPTYKIGNNEAHVHLFGRLENGESFLTINKFRPYFYIKKSDFKKASAISKFDHEETKMKNFQKEEMVKVILNNPKDVKPLRETLEIKGIACYEADIRFAYRFLIDHEIKASMEIDGEFEKPSESDGIYVDRIYREPKLSKLEKDDFDPELKVLSFDIESNFETGELYCIGFYGDGTKKENVKEVIIVSDKTHKNAISVPTEKDLLLEFQKKIIELDPDIITGWNMIEFDLAELHKKFKKHKIDFKFGRNDWNCTLRIESEFFKDSKADFPGRAVIDGIAALKGSFIKLDSYTLDNAAEEFVGEKKLLHGKGRFKEIDEFFKNDQDKLIAYNLKDAELAYKIFINSDALALTIERSKLTGMQLERVSASIASMDFVYITEARKRNIVVNSMGRYTKESKTKGGYVKESRPGIYDNIVILDFKSLYPSIIRTFNIDPASLVHEADRENLDDYKDKSKFIIAPNNAVFRNDEGILPEMLQHLWAQRDKAKKSKNKLASYAIKILMNSFYGVLASPNCRFYSPLTANAITYFGEYLIKLTSKKIEEKGYEVIYNDTDSTFVFADTADYEKSKKIGDEIEKVYKKFLMPKHRHSESGAKKRYAGTIIDEHGKEDLQFVGMEFVRRDWTDLAKKFQMELLNKVFKGEEVTKYVKDFVDKLKEGKYDDLLIYRKALRKGVEDYTKTTPPHVKAAKQLTEDELDGNLIEYYMTLDGPQLFYHHVSHPI